MNMLRRHSVFPIALLLLISIAGGAFAKEPGGATPNEVLTRVTEAIRTVNVNEIALCQSAYVRDSPDAATTFAGMHKLSPISRQLVIDGVKKFDAREFIFALGMPGMMFISQCAEDPSSINNLLLTKGTLVITGDKAEYTYKVSETNDEILSKQPEIAKFQKAMKGDARTKTLTARFIKLDGRWFIESPDSKAIDACGKIYQPFSEYLQQVRKCLDASKDITEFKAAMAKPVAEFKQAVTDAMTAK